MDMQSLNFEEQELVYSAAKSELHAQLNHKKEE